MRAIWLNGTIVDRRERLHVKIGRKRPERSWSCSFYNNSLGKLTGVP
jgi:hypothetical protein